MKKEEPVIIEETVEGYKEEHGGRKGKREE